MSVNGRGAYYKAKYGGRGKGKGNSTHPHGEALSSYKKENNDEATVPDHFAHQAESNRQDLQKLSRNLKNIDGMQYGNYKLLSGQRYVQIDKPFPFSLEFVHIQTDAYASPSRISIRILLNDIGFHPDLLSSRVRRVAVSDFLARNFTSIISGSIGIPNAAPRGWAGLKGGCINMSRPSQHILQRTSVSISETPLGTCIMEARITVSLPARGRTIEGGLADTILVKELPLLLESAFSYHKLDGEALRDHVYLVEDQQFLRAALDDAGLVAFVSEASLLARKSGASDLPLDTESAVRFQPPASLLREIVLPNRGAIRGMGIPKGITLIVGGGYHGKSTLLSALEVGVYDHIRGDGREFVVCDPTAVKIKSEDGRAVTDVDISPFINNLPLSNASTTHFSTTSASGSTSQAANIIEAVDMGSKLLLLDEDTCATNFMVRDDAMRALVADAKEPITPFIDRARSLFRDCGVSTILVMGGSGSYFSVADTVIMMDAYVPIDVTAKAKEIATSSNAASSSTLYRFNGSASNENGPNKRVKDTLVLSPCRGIIQESLRPSYSKVYIRNNGIIEFGKDCPEEAIDFSATEQLVEIGQTRTIAELFLRLGKGIVITHDRGTLGTSSAEANSLREIVDQLVDLMTNQGIDAGVSFPECRQGLGDLTLPRTFEIAAAINRWRKLQRRSSV